MYNKSARLMDRSENQLQLFKFLSLCPFTQLLMKLMIIILLKISERASEWEGDERRKKKKQRAMCDH